jgi:hypothetical protein
MPTRADTEGAVLLTADNRVQDVPNTAGNWNWRLEPLVPVMAQKDETFADINADKTTLV